MISIVMAYHNRLELLTHSLATMATNNTTEFEVIIVDDFSNENNQLDNIIDSFPTINITVVKMSNYYTEKTYSNPCVVYNIGFRCAKGDKIIIQNPECCHEGNVISYVDQHLTDGTYLSFNCYASTETDLKRLHRFKTIPLNEIGAGFDEGGCWYNHDVLNPTAYHFASAITKKDLSELNGFDERFAFGFGYDDNEFLQRIKNKQLDIKFVSNPFVIHQYHEKTLKPKLLKVPSNKGLYEQTVSENLVRANNEKSL